MFRDRDVRGLAFKVGEKQRLPTTVVSFLPLDPGISRGKRKEGRTAEGVVGGLGRWVRTLGTEEVESGKQPVLA